MLKLRSLNLFQSKLIVILFVILPIALFAQDEPIVKVYDTDGSYTQYNIEEIENIIFLEDSYSTKFQVYAYDSLAFDKYTYFIENVEIINDKENYEISVVHNINRYSDPLFDNYAINKIDSIIIINTNLYFNRIYSKIEVNIDPFETDYFSITSIKYNEHEPIVYDTVAKKVQVSIEYTAENYFLLPDWMYSYNPCYNFSRNSDLFFCFEDYEFDPGGDTFHEEYFYNKYSVNIINDSLLNINIESWGQENRYGYTTSFSSTKNFNETIVLINLPYELNEDSTIIIDTKLIEIDSLQYLKTNSSSSSSGGGSFSGRNEKTELKGVKVDKPIKLKMVIR